jgi:hypothetical protein
MNLRQLVVVLVLALVLVAVVDAKKKPSSHKHKEPSPYVPDSPQRAACKQLCRDQFNVRADMCRLYGINRQVCYDNAGFLLRDCYNRCLLLPIWNPNEQPLPGNDWQ